MFGKKECVALVLAGGKGKRLEKITDNMAKPAVFFGGKYRIIDFVLSNCVNSGIDTVGVLTQYQPHELRDYIGNGSVFGLDSINGGVHILPPFQRCGGGKWYKGTANAVFQNLNFLERYNPRCVLVLSGDHIYKMDYSAMLKHHKKSGADCTVASFNVPIKDAGRFGVIEADENGRIHSFEEKPKNPKSNLISMGVYIFNFGKLKEYLLLDEDDKASENDFGKNVLPAMLCKGEKLSAYRFDGYWRDVGTVKSLWEGNMDLLKEPSPISVSKDFWKIYSPSLFLPPQFIGKGGSIKNSILTEGCEIYGSVENSVISIGVKVLSGTVVKNSVIMPNAVIGENCYIENAVVMNNAYIENGKIISNKTSEENVTLVT